MDASADSSAPGETTLARLARQLEELQLLTCSLLPGETLAFIPDELAAFWTSAIETYSMDPKGETLQVLLQQRLSAAHAGPSACSIGGTRVSASPIPTGSPPTAHFRVGLELTRTVWFEVELPNTYPDDTYTAPSISIKGEALGREEQMRWQEIVRQKQAQVADSDFPIYQLFSEHLLPLLHAKLEHNGTPPSSPQPESALPTPPVESAGAQQSYHALLTSHHLVSPQKRRNMQQWSAALSVSGFAKVGHPGVIYCEGAREGVEEFVGNVKAMQWLALRVRFVEPLGDAKPTPSSRSQQKAKGRWIELEKVGDVVQEMKRLGRDSYVVEMGIGSAGTSISK
ncbi:hypothetical protein EW146_g8744 [Bondarzewia mesenterica]|uniref:Small nuclear ribonucleoprotein Prp3 C-terminal domain-containing protein n=1 Tax=Bondarzewia mesenterica TaxID=1095465 RepID=A0A4S4LC24_9AGAM|nr:hypothetical protein EW146_g8744 [Bondarzewia mesenterica]